jgi:AcrR family transcriptional regulator
VNRRERKKRAVRAAVLDAAAALFEERGFEETKIDAIAAAADVAVGTVYNHFATKSDVLLTILLSDVDEVIEQSQGLVANPPAGTARAVHAVVSVVLAAMERRPRRLWRQIFGEAMLDPQNLGAAFAGVLRRLQAQLRATLETQRARGALEARWSPESAADVAFAIAYTLVHEYVRDERITAGEFGRTLQRRLQSVF